MTGVQTCALPISASGLDKDALHIYFGLALFLAARLSWRRAGGWLIAWGAVLAMACGGEWLDMTSEIRNAAIQPDAAHWHDIWNTLFWPTVLLVAGRWLHPRERGANRSEEHTSELQSLMRISYAVFCWKKTKQTERKTL